jgi:hypothetical protein
MWENLENKYNHCQVMIIQKKRRGCIALYCFYNDKGAKKLSHYIRSLEHVFWYREPKDYIEVIYNPQIQISAESETKRSIFREKDKTKRSKKESAQHSKSRNKSFVMTSVSAL